MSKIVIIRGNSGSGKTTLSKTLQRKIGRNTFLISQDYVRREMLWVLDRPDNQAVHLLENLIIYGHKNCSVTILEGILYANIYKSLFEKIKNLFNDNIYAYYFDLTFEETVKRHEQSEKTNDFSELDMKKWWRDKDLLPNILEKMINKEMNLDEIVQQIYDDIN